MRTKILLSLSLSLALLAGVARATTLDATPETRNSPEIAVPERVKLSAFSGTAAYAYRFDLPSGPGGLTPSLVLTHSTETKSTEYGYGWKLNLGWIERCTRFQAPFYVSPVATGADRDVFELDGDLLVRDGDTNAFRLRHSDASLLVYEAGDDTWERIAPDGTRFVYGSTANSRIYRSPGSAHETFRWGLSEVIDPRGNAYRILYDADLDTTPSQAGIPAIVYPTYVYPAAIEYGFHHGQALARQRRVELEWGPRAYPGETGPSATACDGLEDCPTSYRAGFKVQQRRRLTGVVVSLEEGGSFEPVRRYELLYAPKTSDAVPTNPPYSRLDAIQRYGRPTAGFPDGEPFPTATTFAYQPVVRGFSALSPHDWTADDAEAAIEAQGPNPGLSNEPETSTDRMVIDFDADGFADRLRIENGVWQVAYGTPTGFEHAGGSLVWNPVSWQCQEGESPHTSGCGAESFALTYGHGIGAGAGFQREDDLIDMDGDGRPDRVSKSPQGAPDPETYYRAMTVWLNREDASGQAYFAAPTEWAVGDYFHGYDPFLVLSPNTSAAGGPGYFGSEILLLVSDISGDGRPDILGNNQLFVNDGGGFGDAVLTQVESQSFSNEQADGPFAWSIENLIDVNGDGLLDFIPGEMCLGETGWVHFNLGVRPEGAGGEEGAGLWQQRAQVPGTFGPTNGHEIPAAACSPASSWMYTELRAGVNRNGVIRTLLDLNGDGIKDYVASVWWTDGSGFEVYFGLGDGRFLTTAATGGPEGMPGGVRWDMTGIPQTPLDPPVQASWPHAVGRQWGVDQDVRTMDMNGDGLPDYVHSLEQVYLHPGPTGLLETITNEIGGVTTLAYAPSTHFPLASDPELDSFISLWDEGTLSEALPDAIVPDPRPRWVVAQVAVSDGRPMTPDEVQALEYARFRFDALRRESFGARVAEIADAEGLFTRSVFHQAPALRGKRAYAQRCDADECYQLEFTTWEDAYDGDPSRLGGSFLARPTLSETVLCDDNADGSPNCMGASQWHRTEREFDPVTGNLTLERDCGGDGDCATESDNLVVTREYASTPANDWMVSYAVEESTWFGSHSVPANLVSRSFLHYDTSTFTAGSPSGPVRCAPGGSQPCGGLVAFRETLREIGSPDTWAAEAWTWDAHGNLATYTDAVAYFDATGATQTASWDASGAYPLTIQNALGHTAQFRFDEGLGQVAKALAPNGYLQCWERDGFGRLEGRSEHATGVDPDPGWEDTSCDTPLAAFAFEAVGTPNGQRIVATLEAGGGLDQVRSLRFFDGLGREYQSESESHREAFDVVTRAWGPRGELACETLPYRRTGGLATAMPGLCSDMSRSHRLTSYDELLRPTKIALVAVGSSAVDELTVRYGVDAFGGGANPGLGTLFVERREIHANFMMDPTANRVQYVGRNARGEVVFLREGTDATQTTVIERDPKGRIGAVDGPEVILVGSATDANRLEIAYNAVDQRTKLVQPQTAGGAGPAWQWTHDLNGDVFSQTSPRGHEIRFHRDALRRLVLKDYKNFTTPASPDPGDFVLRYHDTGPGLGQLASVTASRSAIYEEFGYDLRGRPDTKLREYGGGAYVFGYDFDLLDRPLVTLLPDGGKLAYSHDGGVLASMASFLWGSDEPDVRVSELEHHPSGGLEHLRFESEHDSVAPMAPTWVEGSYTYRASDHRMETAMTSVVGGMPGPLQDLMYEFDRAGNLRSAIDMIPGGPGQQFRYDSLHRLEEAEATGDHAYGLLTYQYDAAGNLLQKGPATDPTSPAEGRLRLHYDRSGGGPVNVASVERHDGTGWVAAASYSQNPSGAVKGFTKLGASTTLWRDADERIQAVVAAGPAYNHYFDIAGQRTAKVRSSWGVILEARRYVDASFEVDAIAETHEVHVFVGARRVATSKRPGLGSSGTTTQTADAVEYYHPDHVGSNTLVTNAAGEVVQETVTTPFGELHALVDGAGSAVSPQDSTTRYLFTDQEHDAESGLHYFGARFQDPWIGRFMSQDPELIGAAPGVTFERIAAEGQAVNPYAYAGNRPTVLVDPTGRFEINLSFKIEIVIDASDSKYVMGADGSISGFGSAFPDPGPGSGGSDGGGLAGSATGSGQLGQERSLEPGNLLGLDTGDDSVDNLSENEREGIAQLDEFLENFDGFEQGFAKNDGEMKQFKGTFENPEGDPKRVEIKWHKGDASRTPIIGHLHTSNWAAAPGVGDTIEFLRDAGIGQQMLVGKPDGTVRSVIIGPSGRPIKETLRGPGTTQFPRRAN